ncbi:hypothetical protein EZV62_000824 [Acer yangbiense]|uniref:Glycosyltransferase 2-like domain-containing protein n=1 Tax=Acer yangbiense TaxID=1000413 RepID=A0A5C7IST9_9ROSI|nr:hypothetical protein EZV62_000824 [Acer yangbiense]
MASSVCLRTPSILYMVPRYSLSLASHLSNGFSERLPEDDKLPAIDVLICTADPYKEPTLEVMNTVLSAMALDYPPEKLNVYLSDDGGSSITLLGMRAVSKFARWWLPFCKRHAIKTICPDAYFSCPEEDYGDLEFLAEKQKIQEKYELFREERIQARAKGGNVDKPTNNYKDHGSVVEVIQENDNDANGDHIIRCLALCTCLVRKGLLVHTISRWSPERPHIVVWFGRTKGTVLSGTNFYMKRKSLYNYSIHKGVDFTELKNYFGTSNELLKSLRVDYKPSIDSIDSSSTLLQEAKVLASCAYENNSKWGEEASFRYHSLVEDYFTGFKLHCQGWKSVYLTPTRPQFLGTSTTNLNDVLIQTSRWCCGLVEVVISKFCPIIYGSSRMSILQSLGYTELAFFPFYCFPLWCFATVPQLCLLNGISFWDMENEQRIWMIKSVTSYLYGTLDAFMEKLGLTEASSCPPTKWKTTNKRLGKMLLQVSSLILYTDYEYAVIEGMIVRKDRGRIPPSVTLLSTMILVVFFSLGYVILNMY